MILDQKVGTVESSFEGNSSFLIEGNAQAYSILTKNIYSDVPRAIIRELTCNALDAHLDAGVSDPIKIYMPTEQESTLVIEDMGVGMTDEDVMLVYKTFFKSTKSNSNKRIGALGLGGKTPLAYVSQFGLTTSKDGTKNTYIIYKDEMGIPQINRIGSEPSSMSGTRVELAIKKYDVNDFYKAAIKTFAFYNTMPEIVRGENEFYYAFSTYFCSDGDKSRYEELRQILKGDLALDENYNCLPEISRGLNRILSGYGSSDLGVVMGGVYYSVDGSKIISEDKYAGSSQYLYYPCYTYNKKKLVHVNIGDISIQPSREALNYTKDTIQLLRDKFYSDYDNDLNVIQKSTLRELLGKLTAQKLQTLIKIAGDSTSGLDKTVEEKFSKRGYDIFFHNLEPMFVAMSVNGGRAKCNSIQNLVANEALLASKAHLNNFFDHIFLDKKYPLVVCSDKDIHALTKKFEGYTPTLSKDTPIPVKNTISAMVKQLAGANEFVITTRKGAAFYNKLIPEAFKTIDISEIAPETCIKMPRTKRVQKDNSCPFVDKNGDSFSWDYVRNLAHKEKVYYDVGWTYLDKFFNIDTIDLNKVAAGEPKPACISKSQKVSIGGSGYLESMSPINSFIRSLGLSPLANCINNKNYFNIEFRTLKKFRLWEQKNISQYGVAVAETLKKGLPSLIPMIKTKIKIYPESYFTVPDAVAYLKIGQEVSGFDTTLFGRECQRCIDKSKTPNIEGKNFLKYIGCIAESSKNRLIQNGIKVPNWLESFEHDAMEAFKSINDDTDYRKLLATTYPMLQFVSYYTNEDAKRKVINYVALVEKL
jgi:hypothetical protein